MKYDSNSPTATNAGTRRLLLFAATVAMVCVAQPAWAEGTAIEGGLSTFKSWFLGISSVVGVIAVMVCGYAKLTGRMDWTRVISVFIGLGLIYSAPTLVAWLQKAF